MTARIEAGRDVVDDLVRQMTLREKVGQLFGVWLGSGVGDADVAPMQHEHAAVPPDWDELVRSGIGQLTRPYGTAPIDPVEGAKALAATQRRIVDSNRFGIPALVHEECLTGVAAWQATVYPSPLCWGATFDPDLIERMGAQIGRTMVRLGVHQGMAPVLDVARDLRWGRIEETIGEDPYLVGTMGSAYVRGMQSAGVVATLKHFAGYSASRAGRNLAPVSMGRRELADVMLVPFEMAIRAGVGSVMNSYADIDGVPVAADPSLLTDLLREQWGFGGTVVADYFSVSFLRTLHGVAADDADAATLALDAGIDVELPTVACYGDALIDAVRDGRVAEALVDRALRRVLTQKEKLGLLDPGFECEPPLLVEAIDEPLDTVETRRLARAIAQRSVVLLHNDGTLPLAAGARIALVGPGADTAQAFLGCYSFPRHVGVHHPDVPLGVDMPTVRDALSAAGHDVVHELGCPVEGGDDEGIAAAARAAAAADLCVIVLGDRAGLFGTGTSGEGNDVADLRLPGRQEELLEAALASGTPVVLVLLVGRPYELSRQLERLSAVVCGFFPGQEGGPAVVDVLTGAVEPTGRLPISFPGAGAGQPTTYLGARLAGLTQVSQVDPTALFAFGHGLSYTPVEWRGVEVASTTWPTDGVATVRVELANPHATAASEVVQVYLHDPVAQIARPVQQLVAAPRIDMPAGAACVVEIELHADQLGYSGSDGRRRVEAGYIELWVGRSSADVHDRVPLEVVGATRHVGIERVMEPRVTVR